MYRVKNGKKMTPVYPMIYYSHFFLLMLYVRGFLRLENGTQV